MRVKLTDKVVRNLTAPAGGGYVEAWDSTWKIQKTSFGIRISSTTGSRSWILTYRKNGKGMRMTIGSTPGMKLAQARAKATEIASSVVLGADPVAERKKARAADTFEELAEKFIARWPKMRKLRPTTARGYERIIRGELIPCWGPMKVHEITRQDVLDVLTEITLDRDAPYASNRTRFVIRCLFAWAVNWEGLAASPAAVLPAANTEESRDRYLSEAEIRALWRALDDEAEPVRSLYRWLAATGQRAGESRRAKWKDIKKGVWTIPKADTKSKREHPVPLSPLALSILADVGPVTGAGTYIFETPSLRHGAQGPVRWIHRATERLRDNVAPPCPRCGEHGRHVWVEGGEEEDGSETPGGWYCECGSCEATKSRRAKSKDAEPLRWPVDEPWRAHDLRRSMSTHMARLGVDRIVIERAQNRGDRSVAAMYDRYARQPEVRAAFEKWGAELERIVASDEDRRQEVA